ncbi:bifunctional metallophosphatase/5'-nucleotidase, partial [Clostridium botulinum]|nr:bifunctional metallophosphatase/5'-nucleotidase [Clostridium botulinum]
MFRRSKNKKYLSSIVASMMVFTLFTPMTANADTKNGSVNLQILTTTDTHGRFLPYDYAVNAQDNSGSLAQISTAVKELRAKNPNTILVDAGDSLQDNSQALFINDSS